MRHYGLFWGEFGADLVGVKYCSHTLLLHAWVSVRRARAHPESFAHSRYKKLKSNRDLRASRSRRCPIMAPATMARPTMGKEACLGTVGEAWTRRLDGCVVGRRPPHRRRWRRCCRQR